MKVTGSNPVCASIINKLTYKHIWNNQITEEERKQLKGDTINLNSLVSRNISNNMAEAILQLQQDGLIKKNHLSN